MTTSGPFVYKPSRWLLAVVIGAFLVFCAFAVVAMVSSRFHGYGAWVGAAAVLLGLAAIIEVLVGRVVLETDCVVITHWFRTQRIPLADIAAVSLEGNQTSLRLRTGAWKRLPEWLGANQSLGRRIRDRLRHSSPDAS